MSGRGPVTGEDGVPRCPWAARDDDNRAYHDAEWGMPVVGESALLERICLEGFQSGLSWLTILRKREAFRAAFAAFDPDVVAGYAEDDVARLLADAAVVRHRGKIEAAIGNARATVALRSGGGLERLLLEHAPTRTPTPRTTAEVVTTSEESRALSGALRRHGFRFVGPTTMYALLEATGLVDDHLVGCHRRGASGRFDPDGALRDPLPPEGAKRLV